MIRNPVHKIKLTGYGEGYTCNETSGGDSGIARLKTDIQRLHQGSARSFIRYSASQPSKGKNQFIEIAMVDSSLKIVPGSPEVAGDDGEAILIKGIGILSGSGISSDTQIKADFCLWITGEGKKLIFRMKFHSPDHSINHDSGFVKVLSGNLELEKD